LIVKLAHPELVLARDPATSGTTRTHTHRVSYGASHNTTHNTTPNSSEESEDEVAFDPVVVVRESGEGRMLSKWLNAARRRMGGEFPRPDARKEMEKYAEKMRKRKLKGGKEPPAPGAKPHAEEEEMDEAASKWITQIDAASKAIAQRWLRKAQDAISGKFKEKGNGLRREVDQTLNVMAPEDDWYFGAELREEGAAIHEKG
jgi:hypothetical protein